MVGRDGIETFYGYLTDANGHWVRRIWRLGRNPKRRRPSTSLVPGALKQSVDNVDRLDLLRRQGRTPQMRALN